MKPVMLAVLTLFVLPVGGGIPAGVLLAKAKGLSWPVTAGLYLVSDLLLAAAFEPLLRVLVWMAGRLPALARFGQAMKLATARTVAHFGGAGAGPFTLILIAFGVDPMTGRASALAAGHGFLAGWAIAITGDMFYYALIAAATLGLNTWIHSPTVTMVVILAAMAAAPVLVRRIKGRFRLAKTN